jgi:hypothetical protein
MADPTVVVTAPIGWAKARPVVFFLFLLAVVLLTIRFRDKIAVGLARIPVVGKWLTGIAQIAALAVAAALGAFGCGDAGERDAGLELRPAAALEQLAELDTPIPSTTERPTSLEALEELAELEPAPVQETPFWYRSSAPSERRPFLIPLVMVADVEADPPPRFWRRSSRRPAKLAVFFAADAARASRSVLR